MLSLQADLSRPSSTSDSWGRYYTVDWVSQCLIGEMHIHDPSVIVELGAGRGALATAAGDKWHNAEIITVDMDYSSAHFLNQLAKRKLGSFTHYVHDALDDDLANQIGLPLGSVDVAVCNPPYVRPRWRSSFSHILEDAGLSGALKSIHDAGADLLFIAQNLRLLRQGGKLGLILPDGLITAEKFAGVRRNLLREHFVEQVVQLPRRVFAGTEAQTYLVVLAKKSGETDAVTLRQVGMDGMVSEPIAITADLAQRRLDYAYHVSARDQPHPYREGSIQCIRDITLNLTRGSISSHQISQCGWPVFHLNDFSAGDLVVPKRFRLTQHMQNGLPTRIRVSMPGDILIARIGRNLHEKIALVQHGPCVVSDCVFTLRVREKDRLPLMVFLTSKSGRRALEASAHGVGARYLSTSDILDLVIIK
ncbi:N-6 DNA methylase [Microvirgula curvata]